VCWLTRTAYKQAGPARAEAAASTQLLIRRRLGRSSLISAAARIARSSRGPSLAACLAVGLSGLAHRPPPATRPTYRERPGRARPCKPNRRRGFNLGRRIGAGRINGAVARLPTGGGRERPSPSAPIHKCAAASSREMNFLKRKVSKYLPLKRQFSAFNVSTRRFTSRKSLGGLRNQSHAGRV
jgi:hypothetical protein